MITIKDVRAKFPQYADLSDDQLADALHRRYYADLSPDQFRAKIGMGQQDASPPTGVSPPPDAPTVIPDLTEPAMPTFEDRIAATMQPPKPRQASAPPRRPPTLNAEPARVTMAPGPVAGVTDPLLAAMRGEAVPGGASNGLTPAMTRAVSSRDANDLRPPSDPFEGEGFGPLAKRRGQQVARGAAEVVASVPEAAAIMGENMDRRQDIAANKLLPEAEALEAEAAALEAQLSEIPPEALGPEDRAFALEQAKALRDRAAQRRLLAQTPTVTAPTVPAQERQVFAAGDRIRGAVAETVGSPDPRDAGFWAKVAEGGGNMAGMIAASTAGGLVGGPAGSVIMGGATGSAMNQSQVFKEALDAGADQETALQASKWAAVIGAGEIIPINRALKILPPRLRGELTTGFLRKFVDVAQAAGEEAAQEYLAQVANNITAQKLYDPERGWTEGATDAALVGAVLGAGVGGIGLALEGKPAAQNVTAPPRREEPPADPLDQITAAMQPPTPAPAALTVPRPEQAAPAADTKTKAKAALEAFARAAQGAAIPVGSSADSQFRALISAAERAGMTSDEIDAALSGKPQPSQGDGGRYEILDEVENGPDGRSRPTGRKVRYDRETGTVSPLPEQTPAKAGGAPGGADSAGGQPQANGAPVVGQGAPPAAASAPGSEVPQAPSQIRNQPEDVVFLDGADVQQVQTDAATFQYKDGGDSDGVTDRLRGVTKWDTARAGMAIIYERADGTRVIADGHQRLGLAKRLAAEGQPVRMPAIVMREVDGVSPQEARAAAAFKNIAEGSGTATDAAKVLRDTDTPAAELGLPPNSALVRDALGLRNLSDDAFGMVVNGVATEAAGGLVGRIVQNKELHRDILGLLARLKPANAFQAEAIVRQAMDATTTETQTSLFGDEEVQANLYLERAKILDGALKRVRDDLKTFKTLVTRAEKASAAGNVLNATANQSRLDADTALRDYLGAQANMKGPISDALTEAARAYRADKRISPAIDAFLANLERAMAPGGGDGQTRNPSGQTDSGKGGGTSQAVSPTSGILAAMGAKPTPETEATPAGQQAVGGKGGEVDPPQGDKRDENAADSDLFGGPAPDPQAQILAAMTGRKPKGPEAPGADPAPAALPPADPFAPAQTGKTPDQVRAEAEAAVRAQQSKLRKPGGNSGDAGPLFNPDQDLFDPPKAAPQTFGAVKDWADAVLSALKARIKRDGSAKVVVSRERVLQLTKPEQVDDGFRAAADGIEVRRNSRWEALGITEADALAERLGLPSRFEAVPPKEQPAALSQAERVEAEAKRQGVDLGDADYRVILSGLPDRATDEDIAAAVRDYAKYGALWAQMDSNARYDAVIKAKLAKLVRSGNDAHVWRIADSKWSDLTEAQRQALMFEIPEPGERQAESKPDAMSSGQPRAPQTGAELIQQGRAILQAYSNADDPDRVVGNDDMSESPEGLALADALLKAKDMPAKKKVAAEWVLKHGKKTGKEHLVVLGKDGIPLAIMRGTKGNVSALPAVFRAGFDGAVTFSVHNHPSSSSLSGSDLAMAVLWKGHTLMVVPNNGTRPHEIRFVDAVDIAPDVRGRLQIQTHAATFDAIAVAFTDARGAANAKLNWQANELGRGDPDGGAERFYRAERALFQLVLAKAGIIDYTDAKAHRQTVDAEGIDFEGIYGQISGNVADRLRRAGLSVPESGDSGGNRPADGGADAAPPGTDGADQQPAQDAGQSDGSGRVPAKPVGPAKTGNAALDGALDDIFGSDDDVSGTGNDMERGGRDGATADGMGGTDVPAGSGKPRRGNRGGGRADQAGDGQRPASGRLPGGDAAPVGTGGNPGADGTDGTDRQPATSGGRGGRSGGGGRRLPADTGRGADPAGNAPGATPGKLTPAQQLAAIRGIFKEDVIDFVAGPERRRTDSDAFRKWFGNSKVVDAQGRPLVVYHGSGWTDIESFMPKWRDGDDESQKTLQWFRDKTARGENIGLINFRAGTFFSPQPDYANNYTAEERGAMYPVYIKAENPVYKDMVTGKATPRPFPDRSPDAMILTEGDKINEIAVIDPTQVKSIFNRGTWDASSPYMLREDSANPIDPRKAEALESIFVGALDGVNVKAATDRDLFRSIILPLRDAGMTREEVAELTPYLESFLANLRAGRVGLAPEPAPRAIEADDRAAVQAKADQIKPVAADEANIRATLPLLLPEQQDDVLKVERRFAKPDGHGMMITNGTGTGKTFSGGGVIKRFVQMGKSDVLIVAPSDAVIEGWKRAMSALGVQVNQLADTKDAGQGVTITTYANLRDNTSLASRNFDLIVTDESQNLMSSQDGTPTAALEAVRAMSHRPADLWRKSRMLHADEWAAFKAMPDSEVKSATYRRLKSREDAEVARWAAQPRSKVLFLSATPFAYDKAVDYAEGYLFDYPKDGHVGRSRQSGQNLFMVQHFGYRIRYHKLTKPEAAVDSAVFEREFHEKLKRDGVLSGRSLQVDVDYDRKFVLAADGLGTQIDAVLKHVFEGRKNPDKAIADGYQTLEREISQKFNYLKRMQLLEAIKARAAIPDIEKHLALGRKVVVFHDYNVGGGFNPFSNIAPANDANAIAAAADLLAAFPDLNRMKFASYAAPVDALLSALGKRARAFNGTVPQKKRLQNLADFNTDGSGADVLVVQSDAGGAGISMHDITGTHQRVLINLGMPTKPTTTLQEEGRILRVGTQTNAPFRYYTIGTAWERRAFATRIAERSGTVENLALGNEARDLLTGFIEAYEEAEAIEPGPNDGKGGKERDRKANVTSPFEKAKTHYFGRTKTTGRRDQRDGIDFYPTPEPLALKMVEWAGIRPNERVLEPSAGDGAIARYVPDFADLTMVEPSSDLSSRALLKAPHGKTVESTFESYHLVNKAHVIVMNPPFGSGGATAMQHLAKAAKHLRAGGRIVALIPTGPSADKRFDAWWEGDDAKGLSLSAEVALPAVAFERAGTSVMTRLVIIDKPAEGQDVQADTQRINFTGARSIKEFFDRLEQYDVRRRPDPVQDVVEELEAEGEDVTAPPPVQRPGPPVAGNVQFKLNQTTHGKTGEALFVASIADRVEREVYTAVLAVAKQHGGWYSSFRGNGAKPGFQFKSEAARQAFLDDVAKPTAGFAETVYHGTPHDFDRFSLDAIGTGEGAQVFGWGIYFASNRKVAEWYRDKLARTSLLIDGQEVPPFLLGHSSSEILEQVDEYLSDKLPQKPAEVSDEAWKGGEFLFKHALRSSVTNLRDKVFSSPSDDVQNRLEMYRDVAVSQYLGAERQNDVRETAEYSARIAAADWLSSRVSKSKPARLYTVDVPGPENVMDWESRISDQTEAVQKILGKRFKRKIESAQKNGLTIFKGDFGNMTGERLYKTLSEIAFTMENRRTGGMFRDQAKFDRRTSEALRAAGIPGHRYLDGSSRSEGEGSYNYVIYDEAAITILEKQQRAQMVREAATATDEIIRVMPDLRAELDRLDLKRVRLVADSAARDWQGMFHVTGDGALEIVIGASMNPMGTLHHEVIHALRTMNLFTPEEWRALELAAERGWIAKHDIAARYPDLLPHEQIEEAIAEEFSEALAARKSPKGSALVTAFNKIARLFRAIRNALQRAGFQTAEDIFGRILAGEISKRQAGNTGVRAAMGQRAATDAGAGDKMQRPRAVRPLKPQARAHRSTAMGGALFIPDRGMWRELTRAGAPIWSRLGGAAGGLSDGIDRARILIQDRFLPVLRAQEVIQRATGKALPAEANAYITETTFSGKVGRHLFEIDEDFTKPIVHLIAKTKGALSVEAVGQWLYARHALERNARIAEINPAMPDGGSGMSNAEAQQILDEAAAGPHAAVLTEIGGLIDALRERTLVLREDAGLITHDEAAMWRKMYRHYVPLKGFIETDHSEAVLDVSGIGKRFNVRGQESRRALGRESEAFNPLQAAFTQAQEVAIRAEKNRVGQSLFELAKDYPSKALWEVKKPVQKRYFNRSTGLVETRVEDPVSIILEPNEMAVKISGEEHRILFHDERLARAAGTVGADQMGQITRLLSMFSRFWSMTRTMLNPEFAVTNAFRDFQTAQYNIQAFGEGDKGAIAKAMIRDWRKALAGSWRAQGNRYDTEWAKHYREFQKAGAQVSFWTIEQPEVAKADLERRVALSSGTVAARALKRLTSPRALLSMRDNPVLAMVERTNIAVDNAIRLAAFVEARKRGWSVQDAAFLAKELTVNFNRRGEWSGNLNALYPFFNAAVQGGVRTAKALTSRRVMYAALASFAAGALNDLLNAWLSEEDDDGQLFYDKVPEYRNERNFHIVGWGTGQNPAAVPMPYGYNIFPYAGQNLGKVLRGVKTPGEAMGDVAAALFAAFSPISGGSDTTMVSPFFADPFIEMAENKDWTGSPIYPRYPATGVPDSGVAFAGASEAAKKIAALINAATGGDFREDGLISISPETLDHLSVFVTGSAGAFVGRTTDVLAKAFTGKFSEIEMRHIPFLRNTVSQVGPWVDRDLYYKHKAAIQDANADVKAYAAAGHAIDPRKQAVADLYDDLLKAEREMDGRGEFNQTKAGATARRSPEKVMKELNRKYLAIFGKVKP